MIVTEYGVRHPLLPSVISLTRADGGLHALVASWPGAELVTRSTHRHRGVRGIRTVWGPWQQVSADHLTKATFNSSQHTDTANPAAPTPAFSS
ncbi:hypothetical protein [Spirillospora sp. CA-128828]|uniref:hypothetical protein n=1 Tax=Spirillospora sp. CA-128828 TaxID=3240033 RepID=UPI003D8F4178